MINADGTGLRRLTKNFNWHPVWTPDGRISYINARGIWVMDANGENKRLLARADVWIGGYAGETPMAWSPDGELIAYTTGTALWVMRADGTAHRKIFGDPNRNTGSPVWSPDGSRIVWDQGDGDLEIYVANRDGTGVRNVTSNERVTDQAPTWASDGRSIAFLRTCGNRSVGLRYALLLVSPDGGEAAKLPDSMDSVPVWAR